MCILKDTLKHEFDDIKDYNGLFVLTYSSGMKIAVLEQGDLLIEYTTEDMTWINNEVEYLTGLMKEKYSGMHFMLPKEIIMYRAFKTLKKYRKLLGKVNSPSDDDIKCVDELMSLMR
ncbi:hypothetical protein A616_16865 [Brevibacillus brevis X23]|nr:hypothetical protein A616_16865 [Brevibacillus brevis X23]